MRRFPPAYISAYTYRYATILPDPPPEPRDVAPERLRTGLPEELLDHVISRVYVLAAEALEPGLESALRDGSIFRVAYRPLPWLPRGHRWRNLARALAHP